MTRKYTKMRTTEKKEANTKQYNDKCESIPS